VFYRYTKGAARMACDLDGLYEGQDLYLLGGAPILKHLPLDQLRKPGIVTLAVNNVPYVFPKPRLWLALDKPVCFSPHVYMDPSITKFTTISRRDMRVYEEGPKVWQCPNLFMFGTKTDFTVQDFLRQDRDLVWWKSVFPCALQLAWRLGFKRIHLVGCSFELSESKKHYAWQTDNDDNEKNWSQRTYSNDLNRIRGLLPTFKKHGFELISCTPDSAANDLLPYVQLDSAVQATLSKLPRPADTMTLRHSSKASQE